MREFERHEIAERSIIKKYRKEIWIPFVKAVKEYRLIKEGDKIAVCISGGKDSMLLAKLVQQLLRQSDFPFEVIYLVMDPGYNEENRKKIESNAALLNVPIEVFISNIFAIANSAGGSPCYLCARMRRGNLYAKAKELGCNKIALGHHMSDVIETTLMGMMYGSQLQGMLPRIKSTNFENMELIRPMYRILEDDILAWRDYNQLEFIRCACRFTKNHEDSSKRHEMKLLIKQLKQTNKNVEQNIFNSIHRVNVDTFAGYKQDGEMHSFLEKFYED